MPSTLPKGRRRLCGRRDPGARVRGGLHVWPRLALRAGIPRVDGPLRVRERARQCVRA